MDEMLSKFMIEDQMLDLAIEHADEKERIEVLRQQEIHRQEKLAAYKLKLKEEAEKA